MEQQNEQKEYSGAQMAFAVIKVFVWIAVVIYVAYLLITL